MTHMIQRLLAVLGEVVLAALREDVPQHVIVHLHRGPVHHVRLFRSVWRRMATFRHYLGESLLPGRLAKQNNCDKIHHYG